MVALTLRFLQLTNLTRSYGGSDQGKIGEKTTKLNPGEPDWDLRTSSYTVFRALSRYPNAGPPNPQ